MMQHSPSSPRRARASEWPPRPHAMVTGPSPDRDIKEGLLPDAVETILVPKLNNSLLDISDVRCIGSYNWLKESTDSKPVILVPGSPPEWTNKPTPFRVAPDTGYRFIDQNGSRMPKSVLLPLMVAVDIVSEEGNSPFDWSSADFVTDRNGLRKLLRWIAGGDSEKNQKEFRIDTQLAGETTVLLNRWEKRYKEKMSGYTFGFNFEEKSTKISPGCEGSTGHHRIVTYDLGGLRMVMRYELDACLPENSVVDDLVEAFAGVNLETMTIKKSIQVSPEQTLDVKRSGRLVAQGATLELGTVSEKRFPTYDWDELYPQLYLSNTAWHFLGIHAQGNFKKCEKKLTSTMANDNEKLRKNLSTLKKVLETIQEIVVEHGKAGRLSLVRDGASIVVFKRKKDTSCLPKAYMDKFHVV